MAKEPLFGQGRSVGLSFSARTSAIGNSYRWRGVIVELATGLIAQLTAKSALGELSLLTGNPSLALGQRAYFLDKFLQCAKNGRFGENTEPIRVQITDAFAVLSEVQVEGCASYKRKGHRGDAP